MSEVAANKIATKAAAKSFILKAKSDNAKLILQAENLNSMSK